MIALAQKSPRMLLGLLVVVALGLALPVCTQAEEDEGPPPPPMEDEEQVEGDWPPSEDAPPQPPWQRRRGGRPDDDRGQRQARPGRSRQGGGQPWAQGQGHGRPRGEGQRGPGMGRGGPGAGGPGMMMGRGGQMGRPGGMMLSEKDRELALQVLKDINPEVAERLEQWKDNPQRTGALLGRYMPRIHKLIQIKKSAPELYELSVKDMKIGMECDKLSREFREAGRDGNEGRADEIRGKVTELVEEHFEVRQKMRGMELERLERRLAEARKQLEKRAGMRGELIEQRVTELTGDKRKPMW